MQPQERTKPYRISKQEVRKAWKKVKRNQGAEGVDEETIAKFEASLSRNLYKLWNRMSSGSYFPKPGRRVEIEKPDGSGTRPLGIPTVYDRMAQEVVRARLEAKLEPIFHKDSYGYRPGKSAIEAVGTCRERCWKYAWILDVDIQKFFDTIPHSLLLKAVAKHVDESWILLYIERWLQCPVQHDNGSITPSEKGTPQGGVISPILSNLFLHYVFDKWMGRHFPTLPFERFADDLVVHCKSEKQARYLKETLERRFQECGLTLHPVKTKIVYCQSGWRQEDHPNVTFTFLGYTFQPRPAWSEKKQKLFTSYLPGASRKAKKKLTATLKDDEVFRHTNCSVEELRTNFNPVVGGWLNYFQHYYRMGLKGLCYYLNSRLLSWVGRKYRLSLSQAAQWLGSFAARQPAYFAHWRVLSPFRGCARRAV